MPKKRRTPQLPSRRPDATAQRRFIAKCGSDLEEFCTALEDRAGRTISLAECVQTFTFVVAKNGEKLQKKMDFNAVLTIAEQIMVEARRLADWAHGSKLDISGAEMLLRIGERWLSLESILEANGINSKSSSWCTDDVHVADAANSLGDLARSVRKNASWLRFAPDIDAGFLRNLAPDACMGMPHAVFASRLAVTVELLRILQPAVPPKGRPGRRGYPIKALKYAQSLRRKHPELKASILRGKCLKKFSEDDLPPDGNSFRTWLNRKRTNRTN